MGFIDAHAHVWTDDTSHYPLGKEWKKEDMAPRSFTLSVGKAVHTAANCSRTSTARSGSLAGSSASRVATE